ncbi:hypothetical protein HMPREF0908_0338 [Selenomonas flueggei ATCC 43531]|uniref:Uncharacterized protein n=2 Tax=Selenomonas TaxID=970 RepID=C4V1E4_9FIRM|nr:hypothetical protein HMPREF0908_0338 [Selenomonas flueggei ATCC 43531]
MDHRKGSTYPVAHLVQTKNLRQPTDFISAVVPGAHERNTDMSLKKNLAPLICAIFLLMPTVSAEMKPDMDTAGLRIEQDTDSILLATSAEDGAALRSLLGVKETKFHHNDAVLTMNLPQYTQPFSYHPSYTGPTTFINPSFQNDGALLPLVVTVSHFLPSSAEQESTIEQRFNATIAGFRDSVTAPEKARVWEVRRDESLIQSGNPAHRFSIYMRKNGRDVIADGLFLSDKDNIWLVQLVYDAHDNTIADHADDLLDSAKISTDIKEPPASGAHSGAISRP